MEIQSVESLPYCGTIDKTLIRYHKKTDAFKTGHNSNTSPDHQNQRHYQAIPKKRQGSRGHFIWWVLWWVWLFPANDHDKNYLDFKSILQNRTLKKICEKITQKRMQSP
jgi:hypothetical protein